MTIRAGLALLLLATVVAAQEPTLQEARKGFKTKLQREDRHEEPLEKPDPAFFSIARFKGPAGELTAYVSKAPKAGQKHPAIVWITGGFPAGGAGSNLWDTPDPDNEQTAQAYRRAGVVMMFPCTRGTYGNPGVQEAFLGEVDDVLAAIEHLRKLDYVDPARIYLGGHSTGGTLALLVAETGVDVRGVFSFGPIDDPVNYGQESLPYDVEDAKEARMRAPIHWLAGVRVPTFVIEGDSGRSNIEPLRAMEKASKNPALHFLPVLGGDHFEILGPINAILAKRVAAATAAAPVTLEAKEVQAAYEEDRRAAREADDLRIVAYLRRNGVDLSAPRPVRHRLVGRDRKAVAAAGEAAKKDGFQAGAVSSEHDRQGREFFEVIVTKQLALKDLAAVFAASAAAQKAAKSCDALYDGWDAE